MQKFYTVDEFADLLHVCPRTILRSLKKGRIAGFRVGCGLKSPWRIAESEITRMTLVKYQDILDTLKETK